MAPTESSKADAPVPPAGLMQSLFSLPTTDSRVAHLNKILATSSGVDTTLTLVGYSLYFVASQIPRLQALSLRVRASPLLSNNAPKIQGRPSDVVSPISDLAISTKTLAGMCSDFRAFTRLWGLLGVYASVRKLQSTPPADNVLHGLAWSQTLSLAAYLVYENGYYLAGKGVLRGWSPEKQKRWAKTSLKMFLVYVILDWVRLSRTRQLREEKKAKEGSVEATKEEEAVWWRTAIMDAAYTPLAVHWSSENGMLSDGWVGALMSAVGLIKFRTAWAQTA
jgi:Peroxisomal biogenesis factor 11 (PEX11)